MKRKAMILSLALAHGLAAAQQPGMFDTTFADGGKLQLPGYGAVQRLAIQSSGRILAVSQLGQAWTVHGLTFDGNADPSFGDLGALPFAHEIVAINVLYDDRFLLVLVGVDEVRRFLPNGVPDTSFGLNGMIELPLHPQCSDVLPNGAFMIGGDLNDHPDCPDCAASGFIKYTESGAVDSTFGADGWILFAQVNECAWADFFARGVKLNPDGSGILGLKKVHLVESPCNPWGHGHSIAIYRFTGDGSELTQQYNRGHFGPGPTGFDLAAWGASQDSEVFAAYAYPSGWATSLSTTTGVLCQNQAPPIPAPSPWPSDVLADSYAGFIVAQPREGLFGPCRAIWCNQIDTTWGVGGFAPGDFVSAGTGEARCLLIQDDGKLLAGGSAGGSFALARYHGQLDPSARLNLKIHLGGCYEASTGLMRDDLRAQGLVPLSQPFASAGYPQVTGVGAVLAPPHVLSGIGEGAVVDWVFLELISVMDSITVLSTRVGLLHRNGWVTSADGISPIDFNSGAGSNFLRVRHRNHIGVTSAAPITLGPTAATLDLTNPATPVFGIEAMMQVDGVRMLWPGDATANGEVKYVGQGNDRDRVLIAIGGGNVLSTLSGYHMEDVNLDGGVRYVGANNDRDVILQAIGGQDAHAVRAEQRP